MGANRKLSPARVHRVQIGVFRVETRSKAIYGTASNALPAPENGHKKGENPSKQGFSPRHFFIKSDVLICVITTALIQFNFPSAFEPTGFINGFI